MGEDTKLAALYLPQIRKLAASVRNDKRLESPDITVSCRSPICGSALTLDISYTGAAIAKLGWRSRACTLGMASTAIFVTAAIGQTPEQIGKASKALEGFLLGEQIVFDERWSMLSLFAAAGEYPSRHRSILLPFAAWEKAVSGVGV